MNDTRIWSAAQMRALFPHKKPKRVHHLQAEDALKRLTFLRGLSDKSLLKAR